MCHRAAAASNEEVTQYMLMFSALLGVVFVVTLVAPAMFSAHGHPYLKSIIEGISGHVVRPSMSYLRGKRVVHTGHSVSPISQQERVLGIQRKAKKWKPVSRRVDILSAVSKGLWLGLALGIWIGVSM